LNLCGGKNVEERIIVNESSLKKLAIINDCMIKKGFVLKNGGFKFEVQF